MRKKLSPAVLGQALAYKLGELQIRRLADPGATREP
jgi:hypothetical protein